MDDLRVAVVGCGPAGIYTAAALTAHDEAAVDVIDRLPTPFGLVRYGVAPDHEKMKSVAVALRKVLEHQRVRFLGNVELGADDSMIAGRGLAAGQDVEITARIANGGSAATRSGDPVGTLRHTVAANEKSTLKLRIGVLTP